MCEMTDTITISIDPMDFDALMDYGMATGKSINRIVNGLIDDFLASDEYNCWKLLREGQ